MATAQERFVYAGSNQLEDVAWTEENANGMMHAVGQRKSNAWGLYDMSGNAWEWTWDAYAQQPSAEPHRELRGGMRVIRGRSWYKGAEKARVRDRANFHPAYRTDVIGFRLVREIPDTL